MSERLISLRRTCSKSSEPDLCRSARTFDHWQSQCPLEVDDWLAVTGLHQDELATLVGEDANEVKRRCREPLGWLAALEDAFAENRTPPNSSKTASPPEPSGFLGCIEPLLSLSRSRLAESIRRNIGHYDKQPFRRSDVVDIMLADLSGRLISMISRALVLELNIARLEGRLDGDSSEQRFRSFARSLSKRDGAAGFLQQYPVLARQLVASIERWVEASVIFLDRLCRDWNHIRRTFAWGDEVGALSRLDGSRGDSHRGELPVTIAEFTGGHRVVYKPRSLAIDFHFQELLSFLNNRLNRAYFPVLTVIDRGTYGWAEFASFKSCSARDEVRRFYHRQGGYLALLYGLSGTDFHFENLIASGEYPTLVDLETLFHPHLADRATEVRSLLIQSMFDSVLSVGLLPYRACSAESTGYIDFSGLGGAGGQTTPYRVARWENAGTDEMRLARVQVQSREAENRPSVKGSPVDLLDYESEIIDGFREIYELLMNERPALVAPDGVLARFAGDEIRVIIRSTRTYAVLLQESFHPDVLRDALDRELLFARLWLRAGQSPYLQHFVPSEQEDLSQAQIPIFRTRCDSIDIFDSAGKKVAWSCQQSGLSLACERIRRFGAMDLERQIWFIRAALATRSAGTTRMRLGTGPSIRSDAVIDPSEALQASRAIADHLDELAIHYEEARSWIGLSMIRENEWSIHPLGPDLYDGLSGIGLYFAYLGDVTNEVRYRDIARSVFNVIQRQIQEERLAIKSIGAFNGWGGILYALSHFAVLFHQEDLLAQAGQIVDFLPDLIRTDQRLDIIGGAAGCIAGLLSLYESSLADRFLEAALACYTRLEETARSMAGGKAWVNRDVRRPLAGFSHGAAGIAWALGKLGEFASSAKIRKLAQDAIEYERSLFSVRHGNWIDLRHTDDERFTTAWCHGAAGIGMSRLSMLREHDTPQIRDEIRVALETTTRTGFGGNHCLCHGDLGNLELLRQASKTLGDSRWNSEANGVMRSVLDRIAGAGWLCGIPLQAESPGLMTGLAGIGYGLLRFANPERVPSVLMLEPPIMSASRIPAADKGNGIPILRGSLNG